MGTEGVGKDALMLLAKAMGFALLFGLLFAFVYGLHRCADPKMAPGIKDGDLVVFYRFSKKAYMPRELVVAKAGGKKEVRRIVAVGGDVVDITERGLVINGAAQHEAGIYKPTLRYQDGADFPMTVPHGEVFLLADSRDNAEDSRVYGTVKLEDLAGKVMLVIRRREF